MWGIVGNCVSLHQKLLIKEKKCDEIHWKHRRQDGRKGTCFRAQCLP